MIKSCNCMVNAALQLSSVQNSTSISTFNWKAPRPSKILFTHCFERIGYPPPDCFRLGSFFQHPSREKYIVPVFFNLHRFRFNTVPPPHNLKNHQPGASTRNLFDSGPHKPSIQPSPPTARTAGIHQTPLIGLLIRTVIAPQHRGLGLSELGLGV